MPAYCFFDILEITDPEKMEEYRKGVFQTVENYGGRYLLIGGKIDVVEGDWKPDIPLIIEFPTLERAHQWYNSEEYSTLKELRISATVGNAVFMESDPGAR